MVRKKCNGILIRISKTENSGDKYERHVKERFVNAKQYEEWERKERYNKTMGKKY